MNYTINLDCKTHYVSKDQTVPILIRISLNGDHGYINTGRRIKISQYDVDKNQVIPGVTGATSLNAFITRQIKKLDDIITDFEKREEIATLSKVTAEYKQQTGKIRTTCFFEFAEKTIAWERQNTTISEGTMDVYADHIRKLKAYRKKLSIHDIDVDFLESYRNHIVNGLGQAVNTALLAMCVIRKYVKKLFKDGQIKTYPFDTIIVGTSAESDREFLELEELNALHDLYDSGKLISVTTSATVKKINGDEIQNVLCYFLASCYNGLRHSDIVTLKNEHFKGKYIIKEMVKGRNGRRKTVRIPIRKRLLSLVKLKGENGAVFHKQVFDDSKTNRYLEVIMAIAGIKKHITFHCARHTFAINSLLLGIKFEVVSDILGHSEFSTTKRYAKIVDRLRDKEMDKWDALAKTEFLSDGQIDIHCPQCENKVLSFEKGVIILKKIPLCCGYCGKSFLHGLDEMNNVA